MDKLTQDMIDEMAGDLTKEQYIALCELAEELDLIPAEDEKTVQ